MSNVKLENVTKDYGDTRAVSGINLECRDNEFVVIFGRPGAGKTTILNLVAGVEEVTAGSVYIGDRLVNDLQPQKRNVAMAFESYALYPHWSVHGNLDFPLRAPGRQLPANERATRIKRVAELLEISHLLDRRPSQLSGGQRQRVSLGRALVRPGNVTLLDEPIAHLDARLRHSLRGELKRYQRENGATTLYTTPDYVEAFGIADRVAVLVDGRIQQFAPPVDIYDKPANVAVAKMVGTPPTNIFPLNGSSSLTTFGGAQAPLPGWQDGTEYVGIRPTDIRLTSSVTKGAITGKVYVAEPTGYDQVVKVEVDKRIVSVKAPLADGAYHIGQEVWLKPDWHRSHFFDSDGRRLEGAQG